MSDPQNARISAEQREQQLRHLAHELRNCLHAIRSGITILTSKPPSESEEELTPVCQLMEKECERASQLLGALLDFAMKEQEPQ